MTTIKHCILPNNPLKFHPIQNRPVNLNSRLTGRLMPDLLVKNTYLAHSKFVCGSHQAFIHFIVKSGMAADDYAQIGFREGLFQIISRLWRGANVVAALHDDGEDVADFVYVAEQSTLALQPALVDEVMVFHAGNRQGMWVVVLWDLWV